MSYQLLKPRADQIIEQAQAVKSAPLLQRVELATALADNTAELVRDICFALDAIVPFCAAQAQRITDKDELNA